MALEYKRFVWLAMRAGHPVTPSEEVDQAWHLHLCYTRSYWDEMCGQILGARLHHGPTRGGLAEGQKFEDWYAKTLESYRRFFDEEPPRDIWSPSAIRFGEATHFRRVNTRRVWLIKNRASFFVFPRLDCHSAIGFAWCRCFLLSFWRAAPGCRTILGAV